MHATPNDVSPCLADACRHLPVHLLYKLHCLSGTLHIKHACTRHALARMVTFGTLHVQVIPHDVKEMASCSWSKLPGELRACTSASASSHATSSSRSAVRCPHRPGWLAAPAGVRQNAICDRSMANLSCLSLKSHLDVLIG